MLLALRRTVALVLLLCGGIPTAQAQDGPRPYRYVPVNLSLIPSVSINRLVSDDPGRDVANTVSLSVLGGKAARLDGIALAGLWNTATEGARGLMAAGLANVAGETARGAQLAGLANVTGEAGLGIQAAGLANVAGEAFRGIQAAGFANVTGNNAFGVQVGGFANVIGEGAAAGQVAGFANIAGERATGFQIGGFANIVGNEMNGFQVAGFANISGETLRGIQIGGFVNIAGEDVSLAQVAGGVNIAGGMMKGLQLAGLANIAPDVRGVQVGLYNRAEEHTGLPIGLVSYVDRVGLHLDTWVDETGSLHAAVRSGNRWFSNFIGVRARPLGSDVYRWGVVAGLGLERPLGRRAYGALDVMYHRLISEAFSRLDQHLVRLRLVVGYGLSDRLALFGGPSLTAFFYDTDDGADLAPWSIYEAERGRTSVQGWPGFIVGVRTRIWAPR